MKTHLILFSSCALLATTIIPLPAQGLSPFFDAQTSTAPAQSSLKLTVKDIPVNKGYLMIGLYNSQDGFSEEKALKGKRVKVNAEQVTVTFKNLAVGDYALKIFHDQDGDEKLDTSLGIPSEPYLFSNYASDPFSAPEWHEAKFSLPFGSMNRTLSFDE